MAYYDESMKSDYPAPATGRPANAGAQTDPYPRTLPRPSASRQKIYWVVFALVVVAAIVGAWYWHKVSTKAFTACDANFCVSGDRYQIDQTSGCLSVANQVDSSTLQIVGKFCGTDWALHLN